ITGGYCWSTYFNVLGVLFLGEVSLAFLPSKKACGTLKLRRWGLANSIRAICRHFLGGHIWPAISGKLSPVAVSASPPPGAAGAVSARLSPHVRPRRPVFSRRVASLMESLQRVLLQRVARQPRRISPGPPSTA